MDVRAPLVAHFEAAEAVEPGERTLHDPPESAQALARLDAAASDAWNDATLPQLPPFDTAHVPPIPDEAEIRKFIEEMRREQVQDADEGEAITPAQSNGKRPRWKFWSQN
jgi:hypothetical protein